jgi:hypothetical protein
MPVHRGAVLTDAHTVVGARRVCAWWAPSTHRPCVTLAECYEGATTDFQLTTSSVRC